MDLCHINHPTTSEPNYTANMNSSSNSNSNTQEDLNSGSSSPYSSPSSSIPSPQNNPAVLSPPSSPDQSSTPLEARICKQAQRRGSEVSTNNFNLFIGKQQVSVVVLKHQGIGGKHPKDLGKFYYQARIRNEYPQKHIWSGWATKEEVAMKVANIFNASLGLAGTNAPPPEITIQPAIAKRPRVPKCQQSDEETTSSTTNKKTHNDSSRLVSKEKKSKEGGEKETRREKRRKYEAAESSSDSPKPLQFINATIGLNETSPKFHLPKLAFPACLSTSQVEVRQDSAPLSSTRESNKSQEQIPKCEPIQERLISPPAADSSLPHLFSSPTPFPHTLPNGLSLPPTPANGYVPFMNFYASHPAPYYPTHLLPPHPYPVFYPLPPVPYSAEAKPVLPSLSSIISKETSAPQPLAPVAAKKGMDSLLYLAGIELDQLTHH